MRSSETMSSRARSRVTASTSAGVGDQAVAGDEPGGPQHPQRVVGERLLGRRAASAAGRRPGRRPRRTGRSAAGPGSDRAMALTVKSRRDRSASMASAKTTSGLRESGVVRLGPVGGDLDPPAVLAQRRWCRTACPGSRPRRPSPPPAPRSSSGRASVVKSRSLRGRAGRARRRARPRRPGTADATRPPRTWSQVVRDLERRARSRSGITACQSTGAARRPTFGQFQTGARRQGSRPAVCSATRKSWGLVAAGQGGPQRDLARLEQGEQALVEGLHAVVLAVGDQLFDALARSRRAGRRCGRRCGRCTTMASTAGTRPSPSARATSRWLITPRSTGERHADLALLVRGEEVDDPVDGLGRVGGVQGGEHQVPGLGRRSGAAGDGLGVAHLADEDDVGVLAQHPPHGLGVSPRCRCRSRAG